MVAAETVHSSPTQPLEQTTSNAPGLRAEQVLFGSLGEETFLRYAPCTPNDREYAIKQLRSTFSDEPQHEKAIADRQKMWENYARLIDAIEHQRGSTPLVEFIFDEVQRISPFAQSQISGEKKTGLGLHLEEITQFCKAFFLDDDGRSRFPDIITDRRAALLAEVIAPLHDVLKFLGSFDAQIMPDHEVLTAALANNVFRGASVVLNGEVTKLTKRDCDFIAGVIGDHENIHKELGRSEWISSRNPVERAKALFFAADTLTGAIQATGGGQNTWKFDAEQLDKRFIDLYFRHIDPVKGKVFRPEWALHAVRDLSNTLDALIASGCNIQGVYPDQSPRDALIDAALEGVSRSLSADSARWREAQSAGTPRPEKFLKEEEIHRVNQTQSNLRELKAQSLLNRLH